MYVYQVYPSQDFPLALVRAQDGAWETAEVYSNREWRRSSRAATIFSLYTSQDGEYITEDEAFALMTTPNIDVNLESWENGTVAEGEDSRG